MIWNAEYETMGRERLGELQLHRLKNITRWVYAQVPEYRERMDGAGAKPEAIKTLDDVVRLPFTDKDVLRAGYPFGLLAVPLDQVVRIHSSSGTTGKPIVVAYTKADLNTWTECVARVASAAGVRSKDIAQVAFGYGLFTGGFGLHYGLERVGATVIPASAGNTERQVTMMQDYGTTTLISTPSYALHIAEVGEGMGVDFSALPLRVGMFGAEPQSERMRAEIERRLHISATDNYGLSEVMGPGVSGECEAKEGLHINEDHFLVEVIDPETGEHVADGEEGELVFTSLTKEAFPVLRYRTRDISCLVSEPCVCGRSFVRMQKVRRRTDDMFIVRGVNVFPSQVEDVLFRIEGVQPHYQIILDRDGALDTMEVRVEVEERFFADRMVDMVDFQKSVQERLHAVLGLHPRVRLVEPGSIERTVGKALRVVDNRGY